MEKSTSRQEGINYQGGVKKKKEKTRNAQKLQGKPSANRRGKTRRKEPTRFDRRLGTRVKKAERDTKKTPTTKRGSGRGQREENLYERVYCPRGSMNHAVRKAKRNDPKQEMGLERHHRRRREIKRGGKRQKTMVTKMLQD